ncbi:hypothetical protein WME90_01390 [Sorangium sp. So ce375]|uniref:hypothetical protein n=1 Tax=Sorangium sp. So ce375 TaxID=3133306 RepID=UPI003F5B15E9
MRASNPAEDVTGIEVEAGPEGGAPLLGHLWNRIPNTQPYEDLSPGYAPALFIPG